MEARYAFRKTQLLEECQGAPEIFEQVIPRLYTFMEPFVTTFHERIADRKNTRPCGAASAGACPPAPPAGGHAAPTALPARPGPHSSPAGAARSQAERGAARSGQVPQGRPGAQASGRAVVEGWGGRRSEENLRR
jgi:hypothetical protein